MTEETALFSYLLALLALNSWIKLIIRMKLTKYFGPTISMLTVMSTDLVEFMVFWIIVILMFTCVAGLLFSNGNMTFIQWLNYYF